MSVDEPTDNLVPIRQPVTTLREEPKEPPPATLEPPWLTTILSVHETEDPNRASDETLRMSCVYTDPEMDNLSPKVCLPPTDIWSATSSREPIVRLLLICTDSTVDRPHPTPTESRTDRPLPKRTADNADNELPKVPRPRELHVEPTIRPDPTDPGPTTATWRCISIPPVIATSPRTSELLPT